MSLGLIGLMHAGIVWGLLNLLDVTDVKPLLQQIQATIIAEQEQTPEEAPPPPKLEKPPPAYVPPIEIEIASSGMGSTAITGVTSNLITPRSRATNPRPPYPPASQRLYEEGTVILRLYVDEGGRVLQGRVEKSSGHAALDASALDTALSRWRFTPGRLEGQPAAMWTRVAVEFTCVDKVTKKNACG